MASPTGGADGMEESPEQLWAQLELELSNLSAIVIDSSMTESKVHQQFRALLQIRRKVIPKPAPGEAAAKASDFPNIDPEAEKALVDVIASLLASAPGHKMQISVLGGLEEVRAARTAAGKALALTALIARHPDMFSVHDVPHPLPGKPAFQEVTLLTSHLPMGVDTGRRPNPTETSLVDRIVAVLNEKGGEATVDTICCDPEVKELRKGQVASMMKFLIAHPDVFSVQEQPNGVKKIQLANRGVKRPLLQASFLKDVRQRTLQQVSQVPPSDQLKADELNRHLQELLASAPEGAIRLEDLAQDAYVLKLRQGTVPAGKFSAFLERQSHIYTVYSAQDEKGQLLKCVSLA